MIQVATFSYKDQDINLLYNKGKISYTFDFKDKRFGQMVRVPKKRGQPREELDIVNSAFALAINFIETYDKVSK